MFRTMRRFKQQLPDEKCIEILKRGTDGVLSLIGDEGYPYGVPLNYSYINGAFYFHCAKEGHKIDAIKACNKASFTVISENEIYPEKLATNYRSVIAFGRVEIISDPEEMMEAIKAISVKYAPMESEERIDSEIKGDFDHLCILKFNIEHISGKEGIYLTNSRS